MNPSLAVVLGAGPLTGMAAARRFAREGFRIALVGLDEDFIEAQARSLPEACAYVSDLGLPGSIQTLFQSIRNKQGHATVLLYNASEGASGHASSLNPAMLERSLRVNALAPLEAVQEVLPAMRRAGSGTLLFTGGGLALKPEYNRAASSIGKATIRQLSLCLAEELEPEDIHAATVTVCGFVQPGGPMDPKRIADVFWDLHCEAPGAWRREVVLTPDT